MVYDIDWELRWTSLVRRVNELRKIQSNFSFISNLLGQDRIYSREKTFIFFKTEKKPFETFELSETFQKHFDFLLKQNDSMKQSKEAVWACSFE
jgi:hypothetical protein